MKENLKLKRRRQILKAAITIFGRDGFHKGTIENIAIQADIGKGTVYEYFKSKQDVFEEMILFLVDNYYISMDSIVNQNLEIKDRFKKLLLFHIEFIENNSSLIEQSMFSIDKMSNNFKEKISKIHKKLFNSIYNMINFAIDNNELNSNLNPKMVAIFWISLISGLTNTFHIYQGNLHEKVNDILTIFFDGIKKEAQS